MTVGRPIEYDAQQVLDAAMNLFWRNGYEATSLQDLTTATGLARSSFYQAFGSKHRLFLTCLDRYQETTAIELTAQLDDADNGRDFIEATLLWAIEEAAETEEPRGCLVVNTANEFSQLDAEIAEQVSRGFDRYRAIFLTAVMQGQQDGSVRRDECAEVLAEYLVAAMSGLRTMVKAGKDPGVLRGTVATVTSAL